MINKIKEIWEAFKEITNKVRAYMNGLVNIAIAFIALFMILYILMNYFFYDETRTAAGVFAIWFTRKLLNLIPKDSILVISEMLEEVIKKDAAKGNIFKLV